MCESLDFPRDTRVKSRAGKKILSPTNRACLLQRKEGCWQANIFSEGDNPFMYLTVT